MAMTHRGGSVAVDNAVTALATRSRVTAVVVVVAWVAANLAFADAVGASPQDFLQDATTVALLSLVVVIGVLLAAGPWMNASALRKAGAMLRELPNLTVSNRKGFFLPRLTCMARSAISSLPALTIDFVGGLVGEGVAEHHGFRISLPWSYPVDVLAFQPWAYSDLPGLIDDVEQVRRSLQPAEMFYTNLGRRRIESTVEPSWGRFRKDDETPNALRERLVDRWQRMERIRQRAAVKQRFDPTLLPQERRFPVAIASFQSATWCAVCNRRVRTQDVDQRQTCRRCGNPTLRVLFREPWNSIGNWLAEKMARVSKDYVVSPPIVPEAT